MITLLDFPKKYRLQTTILFWAGLYWFLVFIFKTASITLTRTMNIQFCYLFFIAANYYFNVYYIIPRFLHKQRYMLFILAGLSLAVAGLMRAAVALFVSTSIYNVPAEQIDFVDLYATSVFNIFIWSQCLIAGKLILDKIKVQRYAEFIEKEKVLNELNFLRAQNDPHFLFNSLNAIYFQIDKNNKDARESLMRLSEMLRYQLYECSAEKIPVDKEITYLRNYIELQKLRLNKNYSIVFEVRVNGNSNTIAPLLLMPLVENAFKYVSHFSNKVNEININLQVENNRLECAIVNTIEKAPSEPDSSKGGIGLKNLRRRLELLYPGKHQLEFTVNGTHHSVKLILQTNEN